MSKLQNERLPFIQKAHDPVHGILKTVLHQAAKDHIDAHTQHETKRWAKRSESVTGVVNDISNMVSSGLVALSPSISKITDKWLPVGLAIPLILSSLLRITEALTISKESFFTRAVKVGTS